MGQDASAALDGSHIHLSKLGAADAGYAVESGQPFIEERVLSVQEIEHTAILAHNVIDEQFGFAAHGLPQAFFKHGEAFHVGPHYVNVLELEPLPGKIFHKRERLRIAQHPLYLSIQHRRLPKRSLPCHSQ